MELELPRLLAPDLPSNGSSLKDLKCTHSNSLVWNWNETYITSTLLRSGLQLLPIQLGVFDSEFASSIQASGDVFKINEAYKMSATLISITPLLILYGFVQKRFIQGIENTGITGE